jgi:hypothetical protein
MLDRSERVIAKAWADEEFKAALKADARAALASQGIEVPEGVTLKVMENTDRVIHLVLPQAPEMALSGEALEGAGEVGRCGCGGGRCGGGCGCGGGGLCLCW